MRRTLLSGCVAVALFLMGLRSGSVQARPRLTMPVSSMRLAPAMAAPADAPLMQVQLAQAPSGGGSEMPSSLVNARRLADELRYEESVIEYQRYLGLAGRPVAERAQAMFELAFVISMLGDEVTAQRRALEALELETRIEPPAQASRKWLDFYGKMLGEYRSQVKLEVVPRADTSAPERIVAELVDPRGRVKAVRLRHGISPTGPYYASPMRCSRGGACEGDIPPPPGASAFTAYYFLEAVDAEENTVATAASPRSPLRVSIIQKEPWYQSPWVWAGASAGIIAVGAAFYFASAAGK